MFNTDGSLKTAAVQAAIGGSIPVTGNGSAVLYGSLWPAADVFPPATRTAVKTIFAAGHGYTKSAGNGTVSDDTTIFELGTQSLKIACPGDGVTNSAQKTGITSFDATGKYFALTVMCDTPVNLQRLLLYVTSDGFANFSSAPMIDSAANATSPWLVPNRWETILIPAGSFSTAGGGGTGATFSAITGMQVSVGDLGSSKTLNLWVNEISLVAAPSTGVCTFTFDDSYKNQRVLGTSYMDKYGYKATFGPIINTLGANAGTQNEKFSLADLQGLYAAGHDFAVHAYDIAIHNGYATATDSQIETDIQQAKAYMRANGLGAVDNHLIPLGSLLRSSQIDIYRRYFNAARCSYAKMRETYPPARALGMRTQQIDSSTAVGTVTAAITEAATNKEWLILMCHNIAASDPGGGATWVSTANFQTIVDAVQSAGLKVKTMTDVVKTGIT